MTILTNYPVLNSLIELNDGDVLLYYLMFNLLDLSECLWHLQMALV